MFDLKEFWEKDALAHKENCFSKDAPCVALGIRMSEECVFAELGVEGNPWAPIPDERRAELNKRYNDKAEKIIGIRPLNEKITPKEQKFPAVKNIGEVFGGQYVFNGISEWLTQSCNNITELERLLNKIDKMNLREFILPENWESEKKRIYESFGTKPTPWRSVRGPVTLAMSIFGVENLIYLIMDEPDLAKQFSDTIFHVIKAYIDILDEEAEYAAENRPHGFSFFDDDCCMLNPEMYEFFGYPVLKKIFDYISPNPDDNRFQHSDSAMGHLLPILSRLNLTGCNFGPTLTIEEIRAYMPKTRIDGQLAPFTFMSNNEEEIIREVKRDCEAAKAFGRGVNIYTAGSINNGTLLTSMTVVMETIQKYGY